MPQIRFRSAIRGPWLTSALALVLLVGMPVVILTGLLSWVAYGPQFGQAIPADVGWLHLPVFDWPTSPSWLYRFTQGLHVGLGLVLVPVVLAKLWSVIPKLFAWPPSRSPAQALERVSLVMLVGGALFEIVTGVLNIQYDYVFGFSFYTAHYYGAWVFIAGFVVHVSLKLPTMVRSLRGRSFREVMRTPRSRTDVEDDAGTGLVAPHPGPVTTSRRAALATVGGGSLLVLALTAGQTIGGFTRRTALLMPRGRVSGEGANRFPVNRTAEAAGVTDVVADGAPGWRLVLLVDGDETPVAELTRDDLLALDLHTARLPIACVEGWSTTQDWTGVRLRDLAALAGVDAPTSAYVESLQPSGTFRAATLTAGQAAAEDSLLALRVGDEDLSADHGFPARVIVPALPGVHCTKWVSSIEFRT